MFLATKTEECGRKLRDVAKVLCAKSTNISVADIPDDFKVCQDDVKVDMGLNYQARNKSSTRMPSYKQKRSYSRRCASTS